MKTLLRVSFFLTLIVTLSAEESPLVKARDGSGVFGYKDTPKLPWCEWLVHDPDRPAPPKLVPATPIVSPAPPADAVVLFDGNGLTHWTESDWEVSDGILVTKGKRSPSSKQSFGSFQLHLEWRMPKDFEGPWHDQGNSGVMLHGLYEIQIFDSFYVPLYPDGQCASVYAQTPPVVNVTLAPGEWQSFDIVLDAPVFEGGELKTPAYVTMFHNGVLVHHRQEIFGATRHKLLPDYKHGRSEGPIRLAGHGCPVAFRNIWVRDLGVKS